MILSKITLQGFKSFAKKVELRFDGRITAVVGPNGCGKTNIVDAIRWGLGEQRPSILRADRMENIIFGGAKSSRPLGMSEVSVSFDNSSHVLPIDYNDVVVTRRLFRSGESEYLLNKAQVRLKDVADLLMDTGIGADAYSVIELKMVEDILSDKTEDRRKLLEEAAGVTKYKHRLKAAMRKLDATKSDLLRVNDIIQEVERTVRSLKRQVDRARRYKNLQEKAKELELSRGKQLFNELQEKVKPLKEELDSLQKQKEGRTTEITKEEADLESLRLQLVEREKALIQVQEELSKTVERIHKREGDIRVAKERITSLGERVSSYDQEVVGLKKRLEDQKNHLEVSTRDREALQVKITSTGRIFNNKKKELEVFRQGLNLKRLELNGKKKEIIECLEQINRLNNEETELRAKVDNNLGRLERLDEEDKKFLETRKRVQAERKKQEEEFQNLKAEHDRIQQTMDRILSDEEKVLKAVETNKEEFFRLKGESELLQGRLSFLRNLVESREGMADGTRMLLDEKVEGLVGILADLLETAPTHRTAIEAGLGDAACYLLFSETSHAFDAVDRLRQKGGGRATLVGLDRVINISEQRIRPKVPDDANIIGWGDDLVKCDEKVRPAVVHLLGDLLVVEDMNAARKVIDTFGDGSIRTATLQGELITGWGKLQTGDSSRDDSGLVGRKQRIKELKGQIQKLLKKIEETKKILNEYESGRISIVEEKKKVEKMLTDIGEQILNAEKHRARIQFEGDRAEESLRLNGDERQKLLEEIERGKDNLENLRPRMEKLLEERESIDTVSDRIQSEVESLEEEEKEMEEKVHKLNLSVVRLNGEAKNLDYDLERSESLIKEIGATIEKRNQEIEDANKEIERCKEETTENEKMLLDDYSEKGSKETRQSEREEAYQSLREELQNREKGVREVRKSRDAVSDRLHNLEMEVSELMHRAKSLKDRIFESYETDLEKIPPREKVDLEEADREIEELKRKMKSIGPVNLVAIEEYDQEKERLDFLCQQRDDLIDAEGTLKETIKRINETARNRFGSVFSVVRKNFQETFRRFFQGGEADLRLPEGEDPLEARIEIFARPAGKQLRDLDLLSGGERALTAISLLFALYQVKPSPFCILDEIDAPLDDANVERFTRVLTEFAQKTQFIIVTHNKMTMRVAQALYGVTMEEEGVSKIVSVKFEDENR